jgi:hypothetical protein
MHRHPVDSVFHVIGRYWQLKLHDFARSYKAKHPLAPLLDV